jgi:hypothetical protein
MRTVVGGRARDHTVASTSEVARFETETLSSQTNLKRLMDHKMSPHGGWMTQDNGRPYRIN